MEDSWHKKHDNNGVNDAGDDKDRDYFALLMVPSLLTSDNGNGQTSLTRLRMMTTHKGRRSAADYLDPGELAVSLAGAVLLGLRSAMAPPPWPQTHPPPTDGGGGCV